MSAEQVAKDCERAFQNGSSRHQVRTVNGVLVYDAAGSERQALAYALPGQVVWSRKKVDRRYVWKMRQVLESKP